jgi:tetrahydromethanopterin S-methyltransferase subunit F
MNNFTNEDAEFEKELIKRDKRNSFYIKLIVFGISSGFVMGIILFILIMITST